MRKTATLLAALLLATAAHAGNDFRNDENCENDPTVESENLLPGGFLTDFANRAMAKAVAKRQANQSDTLPPLSRKLSGWATAPVIGAYYTGGYKYSSESGAHGGPGFTTRLIRAYVNGTVLRYVDYRVQMELQGTVHLKDAYVEYTQFRAARAKLGQFKRPFSFENPMNPWDVGMADYSQLSKKMSGFSDHTATEYNGSNGGRDLGFQLQGDFVPVNWGGKRHELFHYQAGVFNGQGINSSDANGGKDLIGTFQLQPISGLYLGVFAWNGSYRSQGITAYKRRWAAGVKMERNDWSFRAEYAHHRGLTWDEVYNLQNEQGYAPSYRQKTHHGEAQAWYVTLGVPCTHWLKIYAKWDAYSSNGKWDSRKDIYSLASNFQLHKNLMFTLQWNQVQNQATDKHHHELWAMTWVRI